MASGSATWREVKRNRHFYLFISPFFLLFSIFGFYPLLFSLYLSFVNWDGLTKPIWVDLGNFRMMLDDEVLRTALWNTLVIGLLYIPPMMMLAFLFANLLNLQWLKMRAFFRAAFFLPAVTPMVVIALVFGLLFSAEKGFLNYLIIKLGQLLPFLHLNPIPLINRPDWSNISVAILV